MHMLIVSLSVNRSYIHKWIPMIVVTKLKQTITKFFSVSYFILSWEMTLSLLYILLQVHYGSHFPGSIFCVFKLISVIWLYVLMKFSPWSKKELLAQFIYMYLQVDTPSVLYCLWAFIYSWFFCLCVRLYMDICFWKRHLQYLAVCSYYT